MISPATQQRLDQAKLQENSYRPSGAVLETLAAKDFVMVVGPSAMGKSTLMNKVAELDGEFARVKNTTTRPKRDNDEPGLYEYIPHDDTGLRPLLDQMAAGRLVQYAIYPTTGFIYATHPESYPATYNMLDTQSQVVTNLAKLPFHKTHIIGLVTDPMAWQQWFLARNPKASDDYTKRLDEAILSLEWLVGQSTIRWIYNHPDNITAGAKELISVVKDNENTNQTYRKYAIELLSLARQMKQ
jgi:energy-coupling factor transporter ATP-binding protein EcfA2